MEYFSIRNWEKFQHYKDRNPPWIKLHVSLMDDYEFQKLSVSDRANLVMLWILAAKRDNKIPLDKEYIKRMIGTKGFSLDALFDAGFLIPHNEKTTDDKWKSRYISLKDREFIYKRDNNKCQKCETTKSLEIDHIIPVSQGGDGSVENLQLLCRSCNRRKRVKTKTYTKNAEQNATHIPSTEAGRVRSLETETEAYKEETEKRQKYMDFVLLTETEHQRLKDKLGLETGEYIERLNDYIGATGKKYKSHYHAILNFHRRDLKESKPKAKYSYAREVLNRDTPRSDS